MTLESIIEFFNQLNTYQLLGVIFGLSLISYFITKYIVIKSISRLFKKTSTKLDDILVEKGFFNRYCATNNNKSYG